MVKPLGAGDLHQVMQMMDKWKLQPSRMIMNKNDYLDISEQNECPKCGGLYDRKLSRHPKAACDLQEVANIMED